MYNKEVGPERVLRLERSELLDNADYNKDLYSTLDQ